MSSFDPRLRARLRRAQRYSMKAEIRILLNRSRLRQELRAIYRADSALPWGASMKVQKYVLLSALSILSVIASGQCTRPEMNPVWDSGKQQFSCVAPAGSAGISHDEIVSPKGNKEFCSTARENLLKACPASDEGKTCKSKAKSIFNACYKDFKAQSESQAGSAGTANQAAKTDRAVCMQTFNQQQQACQARKLPPPAPGQPYVPDTCLQDALTAQNKCLANSR
jgi:hypothetical protein